MHKEQTLANALRFLCVDAISKANSGHPGAPLGMAEMATVLWREFLRYDPKTPNWFNRDRFVLSNGHASTLLYALLHLTGYAVSSEDLASFRSLNSKTPGHPEFGVTPGVDTTTGPLGQGLANAVGMALTEKLLAAHFNRPGYNIVDHFTYVFTGDGCLMEGISHEAASFAGTQELGKLIVLWDNNQISIDGDIKGWFSEDVPARFRAYHWQVLEVDGQNCAEIRAALTEARSDLTHPTLIACKTTIGCGSPQAGKASCHGSPLKVEEIAEMRKNLAWPYAPFEIPDEIRTAWDATLRGAKLVEEWQELVRRYEKAYPELAQEFWTRLSGALPADWSKRFDAYFTELLANPADLATRKSSQKVIDFLSNNLPGLVVGSADLTPSNLTRGSGAKEITPQNADGNYLHYGVREFGMCALMNGMALHGGVIPAGGTFLVFANYAQSAIRMAALMKQRVIYLLTHDSIGVGEDGPTHQPIEHLAMLRATPNLSVWRPADDVETAVAWEVALERQDGPTALILSRQTLPRLQHGNRTHEVEEKIRRGGYIVADCEGMPELIIMASGSEVALALQVANVAEVAKKLKIRVISMPSIETFMAQDEEYREAVLPRDIKRRLAVEAAATQPWYQLVGLDGKVIGLDHYGASAPAKILFEFLGFSVENIVTKI